MFVHWVNIYIYIYIYIHSRILYQSPKSCLLDEAHNTHIHTHTHTHTLTKGQGSQSSNPAGIAKKSQITTPRLICQTYVSAWWTEIKLFKKISIVCLHPIQNSNLGHLGCEPNVLTTIIKINLKLIDNCHSFLNTSFI